MTHLRIRTPEGVEFSLQLAGPVSRALALLADSAVVWCATSVLGSIVQALRWVAPDTAGTAMFVGMLVMPFAYGMAMEWFNRGQTLGKRVFGLRVVDAQGLKLRPSQVVLRNLLRAVDFLPFLYVVGGIATLVTRRAQRLGDVAAGTVVVRIPRPARPDLDQLIGSRFNSLRAYPHLAARLRQRVPAAEAAIALQALVRREEIEAGPRVELFRELADHFRGRVEFPAEVVDGLADEQYVRDVVDLLYRPRGDTTRPTP
ncbi:MAG: RDD family protein [Verrucomicrobia bacterium]|nr:MAG: RDD family protein [Verrucomicrobiota bacterium]